MVNDNDSALARLYRAVAPFEIYIVATVALAVLLTGIASYTLIDPWETHYAEVARRILQENDWIHLQAEDKSFRSKPVLTFWLIAGSMKLLGIATNGSYSGELVNSGWVIFAVRLPFALFAVMGLTCMWNMLAKLLNRRVAWLAFTLLITTPFYFMVARQSITDMPMVASLLAAISCFALAVNSGDEALKPFWKKFNALHVFLAVFGLIVGGQILYLIYYFSFAHPGVAAGVALHHSLVVWPLLGLFAIWFAAMLLRPATTKRQVYMFGFFLLIGISVLAKGPPGIALAGVVCLLYTLLTGQWRNLLKLELPAGIAITALVSVPWHVAMYLKDGPGWVNEYFNHHMLNRFGKGVHGDTGTFDYFASQLGIGMWPWIGLLPIALVTVLWTGQKDSKEGRTRLIIGIWAIAGVATFCISQTKFHHYILPAVPPLAITIAIWLDDYLGFAPTRHAPPAFGTSKRPFAITPWEKRVFLICLAGGGLGIALGVLGFALAFFGLFAKGPLLLGIGAGIAGLSLIAAMLNATLLSSRHSRDLACDGLVLSELSADDPIVKLPRFHNSLGILLAIPIIALLARDFMGEPKQLIELFIYRYDRPWPSGEPWNVDVSDVFLWFGIGFAVLMAALSIAPLRRYATIVLVLLGLGFASWAMNGYMSAAAPHWGQRELHRTYYAQRQIHGVDFQYYSLRDLSDAWDGTSEILVESVLPTAFAQDIERDPSMKIQIFVPGAGIPGDKVVLSGAVSRTGDNRFWIGIPPVEQQKLSALITRGKPLEPASKRPWQQVNADRMVAWQLNWHGEDFWSGGEFYGDREDARTVFKSTKNKEFLAWLKDPERTGRTFFIITEAGRAKGFKNILPTPAAKKSVEIIDTSCNKFTLLKFHLGAPKSAEPKARVDHANHP